MSILLIPNFFNYFVSRFFKAGFGMNPTPREGNGWR